MSFARAAVVTCLILAASCEPRRERVCRYSCAITEGTIVASLTNLNFETAQTRRADIALIGIITATSGQLYEYRQLFSHQLHGPTEKLALAEFVGFIEWVFGPIIKSTSQLAEIFENKPAEDEEVKLLVDGAYNTEWNSTVTAEALSYFYLGIEPRSATFAGRIEAEYQEKFWSEFDAATQTSGD